jgi:hypothetical protein
MGDTKCNCLSIDDNCFYPEHPGIQPALDGWEKISKRENKKALLMQGLAMIIQYQQESLPEDRLADIDTCAINRDHISSF